MGLIADLIRVEEMIRELEYKVSKMKCKEKNEWKNWTNPWDLQVIIKSSNRFVIGAKEEQERESGEGKILEEIIAKSFAKLMGGWA